MGVKPGNDSSSARVQLNYPEPEDVAGFLGACFGGGAVELTVQLDTEGVNTNLTATIFCDQQFHEVDFAGEGVTRVTISASSDAPTYAIAFIRGQD